MTFFSKILICVMLALPLYGNNNSQVHTVCLSKQPSNKYPITLLLFHGLGHSQEEVNVWAQKEFSQNKKFNVIVLDYKKAGLDKFQQKIQKTLEDLSIIKDNLKKSDLLAKRELELLPELRKLLTKNMGQIKKQLGDVPLENVVLAGYSLGGLIASTFVEVLSKGSDQVQALLMSMAPPVGFVNLIPSAPSGIMLPAVMHVEIGKNDEIFINGVAHTEKCCAVFQKLDTKPTINVHEGTHKATDHFNETVRTTLEESLEKLH